MITEIITNIAMVILTAYFILRIVEVIMDLKDRWY